MKICNIHLCERVRITIHNFGILVCTEHEYISSLPNTNVVLMVFGCKGIDTRFYDGPGFIFHHHYHTNMYIRKTSFM